MLPLFTLLLGLFFAPTMDTLPPPPPSSTVEPPPEKKIVTEFIRAREQMPVFPGCEEFTEYNERKKCADLKLLDFVYCRLVYPQEAKDARIEGMAVISFIVDKDGTTSDFKILRDPGCGTGQAALETVSQMEVEGVVWEPGRSFYGAEGKPVRVQFNLPVRFKLE